MSIDISRRSGITLEATDEAAKILGAELLEEGSFRARQVRGPLALSETPLQLDYLKDYYKRRPDYELSQRLIDSDRKINLIESEIRSFSSTATRKPVRVLKKSEQEELNKFIQTLHPVTMKFLIDGKRYSTKKPIKAFTACSCTSLFCNEISIPS